MIGRKLHVLAGVILVLGLGGPIDPSRAQGSLEPVTLVDYENFPEGWNIRGDAERLPEIYRIREEGGARILSAQVTGDPIRIFKKVAWNPYAQPILSWKWRVQHWPEQAGASVEFYVSLDRDSLGIPTIIKYLWSDELPVGTKRRRGFFSPAEVVIRSGAGPPGEWVTEHLNVLESFREIYGADPDHRAVGVGLRVSSGVEMEITGIVALPIENGRNPF